MKIRNLAITAVAVFGLLASGSQAFAQDHGYWHGDRDRHDYRADHFRHDRDDWRYRDHGYYGGYQGGYYAAPYAADPYYAAPYVTPRVVVPPPVVVRPYRRPGFGFYFGIR